MLNPWYSGIIVGNNKRVCRRYKTSSAKVIKFCFSSTFVIKEKHYELVQRVPAAGGKRGRFLQKSSESDSPLKFMSLPSEFPPE